MKSYSPMLAKETTLEEAKLLIKNGWIVEMEKQEKKRIWYLVGVSFGDAYCNKCFSKKAGYWSWGFKLTSKDIEFVEKFRNYILMINPEIIKSEIKHQYNKKYNKYYYYFQVQKKNVVQPFLQKKNINKISKLPLYLKKEVMRGFFDSEGAITRYNRKRIKKINNRNYFRQENSLLLRISNTNKQMIDFCCRFFEKAKIKHTISAIHQKQICYHICIWNNQAIKFWEMLGKDFTIKRKNEKMREYEKYLKERLPLSVKYLGNRNPNYGKIYSFEKRKKRKFDNISKKILKRKEGERKWITNLCWRKNLVSRNRRN